MLASAGHTNRAFESELRSLREAVAIMAGRVEQMLSRALQALVQRDAKLAQRTILEDPKVNRAELEIDEQCLRILARRQPLASDLRFITLALKMVTDLERVGDIAVNIAERAIDLSQTPQAAVLHDGIPQMEAIVQRMIGDAIGAFVNRDLEMARAVVRADDEIDALYDEVFGDLLRVMREDARAEQLHAVVHVMSVAKWLERAGDHAVHLAELVIFMIDGTDVRHTGKLGERASGPDELG
ncbi:MAG: phosphate signaling complex protein PhoU [Myxococcales bacterium]|nr:phosphate signaling complex protein PhoU [Myxococcales bacterium]